jgi:hypothetical protein
MAAVNSKGRSIIVEPSASVNIAVEICVLDSHPGAPPR